MPVEAAARFYFAGERAVLAIPLFFFVAPTPTTRLWVVINSWGLFER